MRLGDVCCVRGFREDRRGEFVGDSRLLLVMGRLQRNQTRRIFPNNFSHISIVLEQRLPPSHLHQPHGLEWGGT